jgi:hypothetical protein
MPPGRAKQRLRPGASPFQAARLRKLILFIRRRQREVGSVALFHHVTIVAVRGGASDTAYSTIKFGARSQKSEKQGSPPETAAFCENDAPARGSPPPKKSARRSPVLEWVQRQAVQA